MKKDTKEIFYVGIGKTDRRAYRRDQRNKYWKHIVDKYGFSVEILEHDISWEDACKMEIDLIAKYGRKDLKKGVLCNMTNGGEGAFGRVLTEDHKRKISEGHKGKKPSPEHLEKMWNANRGRKLTNEHKAKISTPVSQFSKDGTFIRDFTSISEAVKLNKMAFSHIGKVCKGKGKTAGGFIWKYKEN